MKRPRPILDRHPLASCLLCGRVVTAEWYGSGWMRTLFLHDPRAEMFPAITAAIGRWLRERQGVGTGDGSYHCCPVYRIEQQPPSEESQL